MASLAISQYGMHTRTFSPLSAPLALIRLAGAVSKLSGPFIGVYALSNLHGAEAKRDPKWEPGKPQDQFVECMNACDKIEAEFLKLLCYAGCGVIELFKKKEK